MGLFGNKTDRKLSFALGGYKFTANDEYVSYQSIYGKSFRVLRKDIESVSLDKGGMGKNIIKVNGRGTLLAEIELPKSWSEQAQDFIRKEALGGSSNNLTSNVGDLEKLAELKDKGIISQEEFNKKKKQILGL
jgi:hypothetical protein